MTRRTVLGFLTPGLAILHFVIHVGFGIENGAPDLLTLALLLAVRETGLGAGAALGFFFGLLEDAFSVLAFGANALAMTVVGTLGARTRDLFVGDSVLFVFAYLVTGKFLRDLLYWIVAGVPVREPFLNAVLIDGTLGALYMALVGLILVGFLGGAKPVQ